MILRRTTGTDKSVKERKGLKRKFAAYAGLMFGLILTAGLFAGCSKKDAADSDNATEKNVTSSAQTESGNAAADVDLSIFCGKELKRCYG